MYRKVKTDTKNKCLIVFFIWLVEGYQVRPKGKPGIPTTTQKKPGIKNH